MIEGNQLKITCLGHIRVVYNGRCTELDTRKTLALLIYLACTQQPVKREALATLFWEDVPEENARASLSVALSKLRKQFPGCISATREDVGLNPDLSIQVDASKFVRAWQAWCKRYKKGKRRTPAAAADLEQIVSVYRGSFLETLQVDGGATFDEWVLIRRARLERLASEALEALATAYLHHGEYRRGLRHARHLLRIDPFQEPAHALLMLLLARGGKRSAALTHFDQCRQMLREELGVAPGAALQAVYERIAATVPNYPLPARPAFTAGQEATLEEMKGRLLDPDCRLLVLTGPGGIGKTHLAREVAWDLRRHFLGGVCYVPLADGKGSADLAAVLGSALGLEMEHTDSVQQLWYYLRHRELLLVLDGFERALPAAGRLSELLAHAPHLHILVTSRERLGLAEEWTVSLDGLSFPERDTNWEGVSLEQLAAEYGGIELFWREAQRLNVPIPEQASEIKAISDICRLVNGFPLGIQLATAWLRLLTPSEVAMELTESLDFLAGAESQQPGQHNGILLTLLSYMIAALTAAERKICLRLAVFPDSFDARAAQYIAGCDRSALLALVDKSLLRRDPLAAPTGRQWPRFFLPYALRHRLREELSQEPDELMLALDRHAEYYSGYLSDRPPLLRGAQPTRALAELDSERANIRQAWEHAVAHCHHQWLTAAAPGLGAYYRQRGYYEEGERHFGGAVRRLQDLAGTEVVRGRLLIWQAIFLAVQGETDAAFALLKQSLSLLATAGDETRKDRAFAYLQLSKIVAEQDLAEAEQLGRSALALYEACGEKHGLGMVLEEMAGIKERQGQWQEASGYYASSLYYLESSGDIRRRADLLSAWANGLAAQGSLAEAEEKARQAHAVYQQLNHRASQGHVLRQLGRFLLWQGEFMEAALLFRESRAIYEQIGHWRRLPEVHNLLAIALASRGDYEQARQNLQLTLLQVGEGPQEAVVAQTFWLEGWIAIATGQAEHAKEQLEESVRLYRTLGERVELLHAWVALISAEVYLGNLEKAWRQLLPALELAGELHYVVPALATLNAAILLLIAIGEIERAVELSTLVRQYPLVARSKLLDDSIQQPLEAASKHLGVERLQAARRRGQTLDLWGTVELVREELALPAQVAQEAVPALA